jgi:hypothetical protein
MHPARQTNCRADIGFSKAAACMTTITVHHLIPGSKLLRDNGRHFVPLPLKNCAKSA